MEVLRDCMGGEWTLLWPILLPVLLPVSHPRLPALSQVPSALSRPLQAPTCSASLPLHLRVVRISLIAASYLEAFADTPDGTTQSHP